MPFKIRPLKFDIRVMEGIILFPATQLKAVKHNPSLISISLSLSLSLSLPRICSPASRFFSPVLRSRVFQTFNGESKSRI